MEQELEQKYIEFLKSFIQERCNSNGEYEAYWNYDDVIDAESIVNAVERAIENNESFEGIISENDWAMNWEVELESELINECINEMPEDIKEYYENNNREIYDDLENCGYNGIDIFSNANYEDLRVNILMATPSELNYDLSAIEAAYGLGDMTPDYLMESPEYFDNMLTEYLKSQGYKPEDLLNALKDEYESDDQLLNSCVGECLNTYGCNSLTACAKVTPQEYYSLMKMIQSGNGSITINTNIESFGLFKEWVGGGSMLGLVLKSPMNVPSKNIYRVQVEGVSETCAPYSVDDVYGLSESCWKDGVITLNGGVKAESKKVTERAAFNISTYRIKQASVKLMLEKMSEEKQREITREYLRIMIKEKNYDMVDYYKNAYAPYTDNPQDVKSNEDVLADDKFIDYYFTSNILYGIFDDTNIDYSEVKSNRYEIDVFYNTFYLPYITKH